MHNFEIMDMVGSGSYGQVFQAFDKEKKKMVAVKKFKKEYSSVAECNAEKEVEILTKLKHNNIMGCRKVVYEARKLYIIMELGTKNLGSLFQAKLN